MFRLSPKPIHSAYGADGEGQRLRRAIVTGLLLGLVGLVASGCASGPPRGGDLVGRWTIVSIAGDVKPVSGAFVEFGADGDANGFAGVNTFRGPYATDDGSLTVGPLATTMKAGPPAAMLAEQATLKALEAARSYGPRDGLTVLYDAEGTGVMELKVAEKVELTGVTWTLLGYNNGKNAIVTTATTPQITAEFGDDKRVRGKTGCGTYESIYSATGTTIEIDPPRSVKTEPCPIALAEERAGYLAAIQKATRWEAGTIGRPEGAVASLELRDDSGALMATYEASADR